MVAPEVTDPFNLNRFVSAQAKDYTRALAEIRSGRKLSHWMWYVLPQLAGLGKSEMSTYYAVTNTAEARAFLAHPILGPRLVECAESTLSIEERSAREIFGHPDDLKLRSCATLFSAVSPAPVFEQLIRKYFEGQPDETTVMLIARAIEKREP